MRATLTKIGEGAFADVFGCQKEGWDRLAIKVSQGVGGLLVVLVVVLWPLSSPQAAFVWLSALHCIWQGSAVVHCVWTSPHMLSQQCCCAKH